MVNNKKRGFTLAEVLATLAVIGVVAAFTIPSVVVDYRVAANKAQRDAFSLNVLSGIRNLAMSDSGIHRASNTQDFVQNDLTRALKLSKICNPAVGDGVGACGWKKTGTHYTVPTESDFTKKALPLKTSNLVNFKTSGADEDMWGAIAQNGTSMLIAYNNDCKGKYTEATDPYPDEYKPCVNIIYDVNGDSDPNTLGADVGYVTIYGSLNPKSGAPNFFNDAPYGEDKETKNAAITYCNQYAKNGGLGIPTKLEARTIEINGAFFGMANIKTADIAHSENTANGYAICVYR